MLLLLSSGLFSCLSFFSLLLSSLVFLIVLYRLPFHLLLSSLSCTVFPFIFSCPLCLVPSSLSSSLVLFVLYRLPFHLLLSSVSCTVFPFIFSCPLCLVPSSLSSSLVLFVLYRLPFHLLLSSLSCTVFPFIFSCPLVLSCLSFSVSLSLFLSLCLRVMLCGVLCGLCRCGRGVVWWSWCVWWCVCVCVRVCVCVCCGTLKKRGKTRVWVQKRPRVYMQNVPVYAGTTRTCVDVHVRVMPA